MSQGQQLLSAQLLLGETSLFPGNAENSSKEPLETTDEAADSRHKQFQPSLQLLLLISVINVKVLGLGLKVGCYLTVLPLPP